ncbi:bacteriophage abortive infection AbiH family protein [Paenibacillus odorifer]|uniref:bacteriophage abortive infection AbiH family protein n=1 Tax=Paenibacillus odorifer TaxID=189426 RepID=UPI0028965C7E|nr:bacteriophage abortive infection AbiH family protein [Paenibacillus odorifer]
MMSSVFIIGNGFDLAHEIKTSYEDFHQDLKENYPDASFKGYVPEAKMMPDGDMSYGAIDTVGFLIKVISEAELESEGGEKWSDLETSLSLGRLSLNEYLDDWVDDDDDNEWHKVQRNENVAINLVGAVLEISDYFSEWIESIEIDEFSPKNDFVNLIDKENDLFLTFNYTQTLEVLYKVKNVCHIHGEQGSDLMFGHGDDATYTEQFMDSHVGAEDYLQEMHEKLRKDTAGAINRNQEFFRNISKSVDRIYSFGFSFSEVDQVYIQEICRRLLTNDVTWVLNDFDREEEREKYRKVIKSCGFRGKFETYHVE